MLRRRCGRTADRQGSSVRLRRRPLFWPTQGREGKHEPADDEEATAGRRRHGKEPLAQPGARQEISAEEQGAGCQDQAGEPRPQGRGRSQRTAVEQKEERGGAHGFVAAGMGGQCENGDAGCAEEAGEHDQRADELGSNGRGSFSHGAASLPRSSVPAKGPATRPIAPTLPHGTFPAVTDTVPPDATPPAPAVATDLNDRVTGFLAEDLADGALNNRQRLGKALPMLCRWRATLIRDKLLERYGGTVLAGPFAGRAGMTAVLEGCHVPKLLGSYERELHGVVERILATPYEVVVNVGCAEGYYAVGLARRMPHARFLAFDTNPEAQAACRRLAERNGMAGRIAVGGTLAGADFARWQGARTLVVCDIEGAEGDLLDPAGHPALAEMDVLVECHDCFRPGLSAAIVRRFQPTHRIEGYRQTLLPFDLPPEFARAPELDRMLALWEWRSGPTPWLFMTVRSEGETSTAECR